MDRHRQPKGIARRNNGETDKPANDDDLARLLPDDVLADILRRLAPRWLAVSGCVCKAWRDTVDARRLLRADLLPLWLDGIIVDFNKHEHSPGFFTRPWLPASDKLENLTAMDVRDHCNGLLLSYDTYGDRHGYVSNPATGWKVRLPPCPSRCLATEGDFYSEYLGFDPTVSTHYQVLKIPHIGWGLEHQRDPLPDKSEWPPSQFVTNVFSSAMGTWEERVFSREGEAAGTVADIRSTMEQRNVCVNLTGTVCWRGALYVCWVPDFVLRICSSSCKCRVIETPLHIGVDEYPGLYLARSEKGVYLASICDLRIQVWTLDESSPHSVWALKHDNNLEPVLPRHYNNLLQIDEPWILQAVKGYSDGEDDILHEAPSVEKFGLDCPLRKDNFEWDSDGDDVPAVPVDRYVLEDGNVEILGFHPHKEIVFLSQSSRLNLGLAYHLSSSRVQVLGSLSPANDGLFNDCFYDKEIHISLPYTPCWIEEIPGNNYCSN